MLDRLPCCSDSRTHYLHGRLRDRQSSTRYKLIERANITTLRHVYYPILECDWRKGQFLPSFELAELADDLNLFPEAVAESSHLPTTHITFTQQSLRRWAALREMDEEEDRYQTSISPPHSFPASSAERYWRHKPESVLALSPSSIITNSQSIHTQCQASNGNHNNAHRGQHSQSRSVQGGRIVCLGPAQRLIGQTVGRPS